MQYIAKTETFSMLPVGVSTGYSCHTIKTIQLE
jgi:hypothetical protein